MSDMSVGNMAVVSCVLWVLSGVSAAAAAVLFFVLDIAKCWRMVSGRHCAYRKMRKPHTDKKKVINQAQTERLSRTAVLANDKETLLLDCEGQEETMPFDTKALEMIQDIVYMQDTTVIG